MTDAKFVQVLYSDIPLEAKMYLWFVLYMDDCPVKKDICLRWCKLWILAYADLFERLIEKKLNILFKC